MVVGVAVLWVGSSELIQYIFGATPSGAESGPFHRPLFVTYYSTALFVLYLGGFLVLPSWRALASWRGGEVGDADYTALQMVAVGEGAAAPSAAAIAASAGDSGTGSTNGGSGETASLPSSAPTAPAGGPVGPALSVGAVFRACLILAPVWFASNLTFNAGLLLTSVASSSTISTLSALFTLAIGAVTGDETFSMVKLVASLIATVGVALLTSADQKGGRGAEGVAVAATGTARAALAAVLSSPLRATPVAASGFDGSVRALRIGGEAAAEAATAAAAVADSSAGARSAVGDLVCILSAAIYGAYTILLQRKAGGTTPDGRERVSMAMLLGFVGLLNGIGGIPTLFLADAAGWEPLHPSPSGRVWALLTLNALAGSVLSDYLWARSVVLTTPLVATLALSLTVPLSAVADVVLRGRSFDAAHLGGMALVLAGFVGVNVAELCQGGAQWGWG
ncbi:hypothetical protein MMPV_005848 [Pyropia vietnamensis]